jgi:hypothetical protein
MRQTLKPDGRWMIVEPAAGDKLEDNLTWCKSVVVITLSGGGWPVCQSATAGKLTMEVSLRGAMVSSVM